MNREDFVRAIDGELWYKNDYTYWLYQQLELRDNAIKEAIEYIENLKYLDCMIDNDEDYDIVEYTTREDVEKILSILKKVEIEGSENNG